jgi:hypothetical protein
VRDEDDRDVRGAGRVGQEQQDALAVQRVERARRLVGEDHPRVGHERAGDGDALGLPSRHVALALAGDVGDLEPLQPAGRALLRCTAAQAGEP